MALPQGDQGAIGCDTDLRGSPNPKVQDGSGEVVRTFAPRASGGRTAMPTLVVPDRYDGGAARVGSALGLRQSGSEWIGDCPACEGSEALAVRAAGEGYPDQLVCVCRGACRTATGLRTALSGILGAESHPLRQRNIKTAADVDNFGGGLPRKRE